MPWLGVTEAGWGETSSVWVGVAQWFNLTLWLGVCLLACTLVAPLRCESTNGVHG
jgi:hypothetical protein